MNHPFAQAVLASGVVAAPVVQEAINRRTLFGGQLCTHLLEQTDITEQQLLDTLEVAYDLPVADKDAIDAIELETAHLLPAILVESLRLLPFAVTEDCVMLLAREVPDPSLIERLMGFFEPNLAVVLTTEVRLLYAMNRYYGTILPQRVQTLLSKLDDRVVMRETGASNVRQERLLWGTAGSTMQGLSKHKLDMRDILARMELATELDSIFLGINVVLKHLFSFGAVFIVREEQLEARQTTDDTLNKSLEQVTITYGGSSVFDTVRTTMGHYLGPLPETYDNKQLLGVLGREPPRAALVVPISAGGKLAALIYADQGEDPIAYRRASLILVLAQRVGVAFERLINDAKVRDASSPTQSELPDETEFNAIIATDEEVRAVLAERAPLVGLEVQADNSDSVQSVGQNITHNSVALKSGAPKPLSPIIAGSVEDIIGSSAMAVLAPLSVVEQAERSGAADANTINKTINHKERGLSGERVESPSNPVMDMSAEPDFALIKTAPPQIGGPIHSMAMGIAPLAPPPSSDIVPVPKQVSLNPPPAIVPPAIVPPAIVPPSVAPPLAIPSPTAPPVASSVTSFSESAPEEGENREEDEDEEDQWDSVSFGHMDVSPEAATSAFESGLADVLDVAGMSEDEPYVAFADDGESGDDWDDVLLDSTAPTVDAYALDGTAVGSKKRVDGADKNRVSWQQVVALALSVGDLKPNFNGGVPAIQEHAATADLDITGWLDCAASGDGDALALLEQHFEATLNHCLEHFPGVLSVDPLSAKTVLPPFAQLSTLTHFIVASNRRDHIALALVDQLFHSDAVIRFCTLYLFGTVRIVDVLPKLVTCVLSDGDEKNRMMAAQVMRLYGNHPEFLQHLETIRNPLRVGARQRSLSMITAIEAVSRLCDPAAVPLLIPLINSKKPQLQEAARTALVSLCCCDFALDVASWAAWWRTNHVHSRPMWLLDALLQDNRALRFTANRELMILSGKNAHYDPDSDANIRAQGHGRWQQWWNTLQQSEEDKRQAL